MGLATSGERQWRTSQAAQFRAAACALGGDQRGARAGEGVEHDVIPLRAVEDRIGDESDRLDERVHGGIDVAVLPSVAPPQISR